MKHPSLPFHSHRQEGLLKPLFARRSCFFPCTNIGRGRQTSDPSRKAIAAEFDDTMLEGNGIRGFVSVTIPSRMAMRVGSARLAQTSGRCGVRKNETCGLGDSAFSRGIRFPRLEPMSTFLSSPHQYARSGWTFFDIFFCLKARNPDL